MKLTTYKNPSNPRNSKNIKEIHNDRKKACKKTLENPQEIRSLEWFPCSLNSYRFSSLRSNFSYVTVKLCAIKSTMPTFRKTGHIYVLYHMFGF